MTNIALGAMAEPDKFNEHITRLWEPFCDEPKEFRVHPAAFRFAPQGSRLVIAQAPMPERYGHIFMQNSETNERSGLGTVLAVGPQAGQETAYSGGCVRFENCEDFLYAQVMYKKYTGTPLILDPISGTDFFGDLILMVDRDVVAVDFPSQQAKYATESGIDMLGEQTRLVGV